MIPNMYDIEKISSMIYHEYERLKNYKFSVEKQSYNIEGKESA